MLEGTDLSLQVLEQKILSGPYGHDQFFIVVLDGSVLVDSLQELLHILGLSPEERVPDRDRSSDGTQ
jgi:hypothetical protein